MKVNIDFHYSDFWADPKRQNCPKAWEGMDLEQKKEALYQFNKDSLNTLLDAGVDVEMVQIGNEINYEQGQIPVIIDESGSIIQEVHPPVVVDAILAKRILIRMEQDDKVCRIKKIGTDKGK